MSFLSARDTETEKTLEAPNHVRNPSSNLFLALVPTTPLLPHPSCSLIKGVNGLQEVENQKQT